MAPSGPAALPCVIGVSIKTLTFAQYVNIFILISSRKAPSLKVMVSCIINGLTEINWTVLSGNLVSPRANRVILWCVFFLSFT